MWPIPDRKESSFWVWTTPHWSLSLFSHETSSFTQHCDPSLVIHKESLLRLPCRYRPGLKTRAFLWSHEAQNGLNSKNNVSLYPNVDCHIPQIEDAEIHNKTYRHGDKLIITCHKGFKIRYPDMYNVVLLCHDDGTWDNLPICQGTGRRLCFSALLLADVIVECGLASPVRCQREMQSHTQPMVQPYCTLIAKALFSASPHCPLGSLQLWRSSFKV